MNGILHIFGILDSLRKASYNRAAFPSPDRVRLARRTVVAF
jgi:hypothetical protein